MMTRKGRLITLELRAHLFQDFLKVNIIIWRQIGAKKYSFAYPTFLNHN